MEYHFRTHGSAGHVRARTRAAPDAPLLHFLGRTYSYDELFRDAQSLRTGADRGAASRAGDRVGLFLPNVPSYVVAYYGAMMAGAVVVNFSPLYSVEELEQQVADSGTRLLVTVDAPELYATAEKVLRGSALRTLVVSLARRDAANLQGARHARLGAQEDRARFP